MKKILMSLTALVMIFSLLCAGALAAYDGEPFGAAVVSGSACVYAKPGGAIIATLNKGEVVTVTAEKKGWAQVQRGGTTAYMEVADLCSDRPVRMLTTVRDTTIFAIRKGGHSTAEWVRVPAGTTLWMFGKDRAGNLLAGSYGRGNLGYVQSADVIG